MNKLIIIGRITRDIELRYTNSNKAYAKFSVAVNRSFKNQNGDYEADFINCTVFDKRAETVAQYCKKGDKIGLTGRLQIGFYENEQGVKINTADLMVEEFDFLETKKDNSVKPSDFTEHKLDPFSSFGDSVVIDDDFLD